MNNIQEDVDNTANTNTDSIKNLLSNFCMKFFSLKIYN
ncbi:hypothetical protein TPE_2798 [Treponema pedis str. T A4]|uniref:Uncharacterized protein n=1 Tax=Treponema pedis str. T A4 TaxID=1291379 RepID=S5ZXL8_9SPIR|nr:hypothetical protein TPE_2798 [Treponema pedis str. T A4]